MNSNAKLLNSFLSRTHRYSRDYYINDAKMASGGGGGRTLSIGSDDHHHDHNNNNNNRHHMSERMSASGSDNNVDSDSVSELEIIFNRKQHNRHAVTLTRNTKKKKKWPSVVNTLPKRSVSVCSIRSYANKALNGSGRSTMHSSISTNSMHNGDSNYSLDRLTPFKSIGQIEEEALHSDIRRCSFRSRNGTNNFVVNPLYNDCTNEFWFFDFLFGFVFVRFSVCCVECELPCLCEFLWF